MNALMLLRDLMNESISTKTSPPAYYFYLNTFFLALPNKKNNRELSVIEIFQLKMFLSTQSQLPKPYEDIIELFEDKHLRIFNAIEALVIVPGGILSPDLFSKLLESITESYQIESLFSSLAKK